MQPLKRKASPTLIVGLCSFVYFVSYFTRKDFAATMASMLEDGVLDMSVAGLIGTALFIFYGAGQLVSGFLGDRLKPEYLILFGLSATSLSNMLMPLLPNGYFMIVAWGVNGFAQAMLWPPIVRILSDNLDRERFVRANLIVTATAHISTILLYLFVPYCIMVLDWRWVFFIASTLAFISIVVFVIALSLVTLGRDNEVEERQDGSGNSSSLNIGELMKGTGLVFIFIAIVMMGFLRDGIESWLPTLYSNAFERDASEGILISVILPIFSIISVVIITTLHKTRLFLLETRGSAILFGISMTLAIVFSFVIELDGAVFRFVSLGLATLICACMHAVNFLYISCLPGRFSSEGRAATVSGLCNACTYIGAAISMYGIALIAENLGWTLTVISWAIISALGAIFSLIASRLYSKFIENKECK